MAAAFRRMASSMSTAISSRESSVRMLWPPEQRSTTALVAAAGITERSAPRVHISTSA